MRAVIQRVVEARVEVEGSAVSRIGAGYLVLLGVGIGDAQSDVDYMVKKIRDLRLWPQLKGSDSSPAKQGFDISIADRGGEVLLVSQFTVMGDCRKGRRPDWADAAPAEAAEPLYRAVRDRLRTEGLVVKEGRFGASMKVGLINDGPVTIILDSHGQVTKGSHGDRKGQP